MNHLAILGSGQGTNCAAIAQAIRDGSLHAQIVLVVADHPQAGILNVAHTFDLPMHCLPPGPYKTRLTPETEAALAETLLRAGADWIVLAGWMRVVKEPLLSKFPNRILNIHPSLLPKHPGLAAWQQAFDAGDPVTGCTVHLVDAGVDTGRILAQAKVPRLLQDTPATLHARIQAAEHQLYPQVLRSLCTGESGKNIT